MLEQLVVVVLRIFAWLALLMGALISLSTLYNAVRAPLSTRIGYDVVWFGGALVAGIFGWTVLMALSLITESLRSVRDRRN